MIGAMAVKATVMGQIVMSSCSGPGEKYEFEEFSLSLLLQKRDCTISASFIPSV